MPGERRSGGLGHSCEDPAIDAPEALIRRYVDATSAADGDTAASLTADDAVIALPGGGVLKGKDGARQFAAKHAETDGRMQAVTLTAAAQFTLLNQ